VILVCEWCDFATSVGESPSYHSASERHPIHFGVCGRFALQNPRDTLKQDMKITRNIERDGTLGPVALNYLAGIPEQNLFFRQQQLRHPASIYNLSLDKLSKAFVAVVEGHVRDTVRLRIEPNGGFELKALLETQEHLLRCLQEHMDDCYLILKTFVDPATTKAKNIFADKYVIEAKLPGAKAFTEATADYKVSLRIANKLKHNQGRLRGFAIYPISGVRLGYFLEEPDKAGVIGPSPEIHPNQGAFSFARDLKWRFFLMYSLSENLVKAVERALLGLHQLQLGRITPPEAQGDDWNRLVTMISKIERAIFPKEHDASMASVQLFDNGRELSMVFPDRNRIVDPTLHVRSVRASVSTVGDGFSTQFKVPFP
jgi:hypothetical protein